MRQRNLNIEDAKMRYRTSRVIVAPHLSRYSSTHASARLTRDERGGRKRKNGLSLFLCLPESERTIGRRGSVGVIRLMTSLAAFTTRDPTPSRNGDASRRVPRLSASVEFAAARSGANKSRRVRTGQNFCRRASFSRPKPQRAAAGAFNALSLSLSLPLSVCLCRQRRLLISRV